MSQYPCQECGIIYDNQAQLDRHFDDRHGPKVHCTECGQTFPQKRTDNQRRHLSRAHGIDSGSRALKNLIPVGRYFRPVFEVCPTPKPEGMKSAVTKVLEELFNSPSLSFSPSTMLEESPVPLAVPLSEAPIHPLFPPKPIESTPQKPLDPRILFKDAPSTFFNDSMSKIAQLQNKEAKAISDPDVSFVHQGWSVTRKETATLPGGRLYTLTTTLSLNSPIKISRSSDTNTEEMTCPHFITCLHK